MDVDIISDYHQCHVFKELDEMREDQFIDKLRQYYCGLQSGSVDPVVALDWVNTTGWESEIYAYTLTSGAGHQRQSIQRVLRLLTGGSLEDAAREYRMLSLLYKAGYPVPKVYALGTPADGFGCPFIVMERIEGGNFADRFPKSMDDDRKPLRDFIALFRKLHTLDWRPYVNDPEQVAPSNDRYYHFDREMAFYTDFVKRIKTADFTPILDWLSARREQVPCQWSSIIHRDFHPYNILEKASGRLYVIDWTYAEISDYRFDLAWTLIVILGYNGQTCRQMILDEYERQMGRKVRGLEVFEVISILRRLGAVMISLSAGAESLGMRSEAVEAMRKDGVSLKRLYYRMMQIVGFRVHGIEDFLSLL